MHYMPTATDFPRLGLIVGKKTARSAVQRNYMKRVLRELFRQHRHVLGGMDILVRVQKPFARGEYAAIRSEFLMLLQRLARRRQHAGGSGR